MFKIVSLEKNNNITSHITKNRAIFWMTMNDWITLQFTIIILKKLIFSLYITSYWKSIEFYFYIYIHFFLICNLDN